MGVKVDGVPTLYEEPTPGCSPDFRLISFKAALLLAVFYQESVSASGRKSKRIFPRI